MTPKQNRAFEMRNAGLELLKYKGYFKKFEGIGLCKQYNSDYIKIMLRTPFQGNPYIISEEMRYKSALMNVEIKENLPYGLDIWLNDKGKVMNFEWDYHNDIFHMISFKRGDWEERIVHSAGLCLDHKYAA